MRINLFLSYVNVCHVTCSMYVCNNCVVVNVLEWMNSGPFMLYNSGYSSSLHSKTKKKKKH